MDVRCNLLLSLLLRTSQNPLQCARLVQRDYLPAIASHLSTAHTLALDKIWTVAIMTSDKRGHNRHDGDGPAMMAEAFAALREESREREDAHVIWTKI